VDSGRVYSRTRVEFDREYSGRVFTDVAKCVVGCVKFYTGKCITFVAL